MQTFKTIESLQSALGDAASGTLGFVPTMGNLHAGHLALVARAVSYTHLTLPTTPYV